MKIGVSVLPLISCIVSISKRIVQEIDFKNFTGSVVKIKCQNTEAVETILDSKSAVIDISNTDFIKISFSETNEFFEYDLSNLDLKVPTDKEKSGKCFWGHVHWVYSCTINKDKTLSFNKKNESKGFISKPLDKE